ncbi:DUF7147 family protein [Metabacillus fastidiosus]|uniref:Methylthioribose kinase n=1 Tax=Metabacillus fastidiosus TaxID=1458 RepID=A0ABU6NX30_9BACI|nr:methylthioribose kinase [Metabacillus fastidiosus]MEC2074720.1 methylthioribose kinase [Metabacillus fastidiosus]MED4401693.1 methylthioribose kinase [Metabacillus fastidiosus]MED4463332.1 methylthioribose kinase [Metabacillus fastidiosus]
MIQRFIELGEGYSDLYELIETAKANSHRVAKLFAFHTKVNEKEVVSVAVAFEPTNPGDFQAIYVCREGIPSPAVKESERYKLFIELAETLNKDIIKLEVKPSTIFNEKELYYQHLIGILRLNHYIPPMQ